MPASDIAAELHPDVFCGVRGASTPSASGFSLWDIVQRPIWRCYPELGRLSYRHLPHGVSGTTGTYDRADLFTSSGKSGTACDLVLASPVGIQKYILTSPLHPAAKDADDILCSCPLVAFMEMGRQFTYRATVPHGLIIRRSGPTHPVGKPSGRPIVKELEPRATTKPYPLSEENGEGNAGDKTERGSPIKGGCMVCLHNIRTPPGETITLVN